MENQNFCFTKIFGVNSFRIKDSEKPAQVNCAVFGYIDSNQNISGEAANLSGGKFGQLRTVNCKLLTEDGQC